MLKDILQNFSEQLKYEPVIENQQNYKKGSKFIICGMGGSNLAGAIIKSWKPKIDIWPCRDYKLPEMSEEDIKNYFVIISSYSGNTVETISCFEEALAKSLPMLVITTGGKLIELAKSKEIPYIQLPDFKTQPRFAIGLSIKATLKAMGEDQLLAESKEISSLAYEDSAKSLANALNGKIPIIYSSERNRGLAYFWKINFNETTKLPAFFNILPELNHNEMLGFSSQIFEGKINKNFVFIFLNDPEDDPRIQERFRATQKVLEDRGFVVLKSEVVGNSPLHKSFGSIITSLWLSQFLSENNAVDPEDIKMLEDFKKSLN